MKRVGCMLLALLLLLAATIPAVRAETPQYSGKSYCLIDAATGKTLLAHNEHEALAPASVTKIMTLLLIMEAIDNGQIGWNDPVTASEAAAAKGGSQVYLKVGETMCVEEMVKSITVSSANDCACAMAELLCGTESAFVERMNSRANELGMENTHFVNCTGLDDSPEASGHKTSAYDIALMSRELLTKHPDIKKYTTIWMDSVRNGAFGLSNTNKLVRFYPGCTGLKTGFTASAGYCLSASALRDGMELIAVVMGCETSADRFATCRQLLDYGFAGYALYTVDIPHTEGIPIKLGTKKSIVPVPEKEAQLLVPKSELSGITADITLLPELTAPIQKGSELGQVLVRSGDKELARISLIAPETVEKLGWFDLFRLIMSKMAMAA